MFFPSITKTDLKLVASNLGLAVSVSSENMEEVAEQCFETAYQACKEGRWWRVVRIRNQLDYLTNRVGSTLLIASILRGDSRTFEALIGKNISLLSSDRFGNRAPEYLWQCKDSTPIPCKYILDLGNRYIAYSHVLQSDQGALQLIAALKCFAVAQAIAQRQRDARGLGEAYVNIGIVLAIQYKNEQALNFMNMGLFLLKGLYPEIQSNAYLTLADIYNRMGRIESSLHCYENYFAFLPDARKVIKASLTSPHAELNARNAVAYIYIQLKKPIPAYNHLKIALQLLRMFGEEEGLQEKATTLIHAGQVHTNLGNYQDAGDAYTLALQSAEKCIDLKLIAIALGGLGQAFAYNGNYDEALNSLDKCLIALTSLNNPGIEELRLMSLAYSDQGMTFWAQKKYIEACYSHLKALEFSEKIKDIPAQARAHSNLGYDYLEMEQYEDAIFHFRRANFFFTRIQENLFNQAEWKITIFEQHAKSLYGLCEVFLRQRDFLEALQVVDLRCANVLTQILASSNNSSILKATLEKGVSIEEIQQLAERQETTFVIYSLSLHRNELVVWVISSSGVSHYQSLSMDQLRKDVKGFEDLQKRFPFGQIRGGGEGTQSCEIEVPALKEFAETLSTSDRSMQRSRKRFAIKLAEWYEALIAPIEPFLPRDPQQTITIIPDGILAQFPFAAMRDANGKYFIEKHAISTATSIKTLQLLELIASQREPIRGNQALIIGNPAAVDSDGHTSLKPLLIGEKEARDVARYLQADQDSLLIRSEATVSRFIRQAPQARWIFASCHGEANVKSESTPDSVFEGHLKLTPDDEFPKGNFHSQQASSLKLKAELVFLSGCYTGTGGIQQEGVIGNVWSFLAAGASSVVGSYWPVPETAMTRKMVNCFYRHLLGFEGAQRLNKAQALQKAMLNAIEADRDHFEQWGVFYLSGLNKMALSSMPACVAESSISGIAEESPC